MNLIAAPKPKKVAVMAHHKTIKDDELAVLCGLTDQVHSVKGLGLTFNEPLLARFLTRIRDDAETIHKQAISINSLEQLRPFWAQGYSSDSHAAQTLTVALAQLHQLLNTDNQTTAVMRLKELINLVQSRN